MRLFLLFVLFLSSLAQAETFELKLLQQDITKQSKCLAWAIYYESNTEQLKGQIAVRDTILQRALNKNSTICSVVSEPYQFSFYTPKKMQGIPPAEQRKLATEGMLKVMFGVWQSSVGGATHFHSLDIKPSWAYTLKHVVTVQNHKFYKEI